VLMLFFTSPRLRGEVARSAIRVGG
jgi:hypothetical protein